MRDAEGAGDCGFGVLTAEGDKGLGNTTTVNVETLLETFLGDFQAWDYFPHLLEYRDFQSINNWTKVCNSTLLPIVH